MSDFERVIQTCSSLLYETGEGEACRSYLDRRLDRRTQERFGFGYFPGTEKLNLLKSSVPEEILKSLGLLYTKEMGDANGTHSLSFCFFENHPLIMPYRDVYGSIIGMVGRSLLSDRERAEARVAKYKNTPFVKGSHVFGLFEAKNAILKAGFVYIVEGQFDAIKAHERGLHNVVALGSADLSSYQLSLICRYSNSLLLLLDNDEAGKRGRQRAMEKYGGLCNIGNVYLPAGYKDLDDYLGDLADIGEMSLITEDVSCRKWA